MTKYSEYFATVSEDGKRILLLAYAYPPHELTQYQIPLSRPEHDFLYNLAVEDKRGTVIEQILADSNYKSQLLSSIRYKIGKAIHDTSK